MSRPTGYRGAIVALLAAVSIWGGSYVVTEVVLRTVGPFTVLALRMALAFAVLVPFARRAGYRNRLLLDRRFISFGLTGMVLHLGLEIVGLDLTTPGDAAVIIATVPAVTVAFSFVMLGERLSRAQGAGIVLAIAGVALFSGAGIGAVGAARFVGDLLVFGGVLMWGLYTVQGRRIGTSHPGIVSTTAATGAAFIMSAPLAGLEIGLTGPPIFTGEAVAGVLYLALGASAASYALWNAALREVDASVAAPFVNLVPVIGVSLAVFLGERMSAIEIAGGAVVAAGVWLSTARSVRRSARVAVPSAAPERVG